MSFIKLSRVFLPLSAILVVASLVVFVYPGPHVSIEFTGGTLMELQLPADKTRDDLLHALSSFAQDKVDLSSPYLSQTRTGTWFVRIPTITNEQHTAMVAHLTATLGTITELQFTTIGPTVGASLRSKTILAVIIACIAIILYLTIAFRKIRGSVSAWAFGVTATAGLVHDIIVKVGIFVVLSQFTNFQFDTLFMTALLSTMGYSVSDKIVIFDRIRDNLYVMGKRSGSLADVAELSLRQSFSRTINTGLGALIVLFVLFFFGSESIHWFILALIVGTIVGTYSSFFVATPLLVLWKNWEKK